jgi:predicted TPR repeat methyltransferase
MPDEKDDFNWLRQGSTSSADVVKSYDDWAATYNDDLATWNYQAPKRAADQLRATVALTATILDVGCGTGLTGIALRAAGFSGPIDGVDLSPASLEQAAKRGLYRDLTPVDLQKLPLAIADNTYDALICIGVLTYVPDSDAVLNEFARMVRPGGQIVVTQRDDLFDERSFAETVKALADSDVISEFNISDPQPYLPDNPDFGTDISVIYISMTAR